MSRQSLTQPTRDFANSVPGVSMEDFYPEAKVPQQAE